MGGCIPAGGGRAVKCPRCQEYIDPSTVINYAKPVS